MTKASVGFSLLEKASNFCDFELWEETRSSSSLGLFPFFMHLVRKELKPGIYFAVSLRNANGKDFRPFHIIIKACILKGIGFRVPDLERC